MKHKQYSRHPEEGRKKEEKGNKEQMEHELP